MPTGKPFATGVITAWEMLIDLPLPTALRKKFRRRADPAMTLMGFPVVGLLFGVAAWLAGTLFHNLFNPVAASLLWALLVAAALTFKDYGRGVSLLGSCFMLKLRGEPAAEAAVRAESGISILNHPAATLFLGLFEILLVVFLYLLASYGATGWITVVLTGAFTLQGYLALHAEDLAGSPLLPVAPEEHRRLWITAGIIGLLLVFVFPVGVVAAAAIVYFASTGFAGYFRRNLGSLTADQVTLVGTFIEFLLLFTGVLLALKMN